MRDDFTERTKDKLAKRVGMRCSNPTCRKLTSGPREDPGKTVNIGVAAHITAASPDGPRYDPSLMPESRSAIANGIWLCQNCAKLIDSDIKRFTVTRIREWKALAEKEAREGVESSAGRPLFSRTVVLGLLLVVGLSGGVWLVWWPKLVGKTVVGMNKQAFDVKAAESRLRRDIEDRVQNRLAEARKRNAPWREVDQIEKERDAGLARLGSLVESIQRGLTDKEADPAFREATSILAKQGIDETLAFLQAKQPSLLEAANREATARDAQEASLRWTLEPLLLQAQLLEARLDWHGAAALFEAAMKLAPQWWKPCHHFGSLQRELANWMPAEKHLRKALELARTDDERAATLSRLGDLLLRINRLSEAETISRQALALDEKALGSNHTYVAIDLDNLAVLLSQKNQRAEAEPLMRRALAINEQLLGPGHPEVATHLSNLGMLLKAMGRGTEAEPLLRRSLAIAERCYGRRHPQAASVQGNLATLLMGSGQFSEAETLLRQALKTDEQSYGPEHPRVAEDLSNLAQVLQATARWAEADAMMQRALAIDEESYGKEHPHVAIRLNNWATLLRETSRTTEAEPLLRRAIAILEKSSGPEDPNLAMCLDNLGVQLCLANRSEEGEPLVARALRILHRAFGPDHPDTKKALFNYRAALVARRLNEETMEAKLRQALEK